MKGSIPCSPVTILANQYRQRSLRFRESVVTGVKFWHHKCNTWIGPKFFWQSDKIPTLFLQYFGDCPKSYFGPLITVYMIFATYINTDRTVGKYSTACEMCKLVVVGGSTRVPLACTTNTRMYRTVRSSTGWSQLGHVRRVFVDPFAP